MVEGLHRREIVGPLKAVIVAGLSASPTGRGNPRNKTLGTTNCGTSSAKYRKMHEADKPRENEEDFRDLRHNSNIIIHQIIDTVYIVGQYTLNQTPS